MCQTRETAREGARAAPLRYPVGAGVPVLARVRADGRRERGPRRRTRCSAGCCRWPGRWPSAPSRLVGRWIRGRGNGPLKAVWPGRLARSWSADGAGFEVFASITNRGGVGPAVRDGLRQGPGDRSRRPAGRTPDGPPAGMSDTAVACRRTCPHRRAEPSRGVRRPCSAMGAILRFGRTSQGRVQSQSRPPRSTRHPTEASGPNVPNQPQCRMSHICWRNTLPRITRRRTRPSTAAREDFSTPSSGIAHVPGQAWTRNRLGPREGGAGRFASSKGQDPVEDVRS
jgi:hypothetical protein